MLKTILKVSGKIAEKPKNVKVAEGDLSRIGSEKFRKVEFVKVPNNIYMKEASEVAT